MHTSTLTPLTPLMIITHPVIEMVNNKRTRAKNQIKSFRGIPPFSLRSFARSTSIYGEMNECSNQWERNRHRWMHAWLPSYCLRSSIRNTGLGCVYERMRFTSIEMSNKQLSSKCDDEKTCRDNCSPEKQRTSLSVVIASALILLSSII